MSKILVVIDMQNDFIDGSLGTKEAVVIVPKVIEKVKTFDGTVYFTRDTHFDNYMDTQEGQNLPVIHCVKESKGWEIQAELEKLRLEKNGIVFDKLTFGSNELAQHLYQLQEETNSIESITLCGLCTDICVISNAMMIKGFLPEVPLYVDSSCCAGVTPESHENALKAMKMCQIGIL